ncbi:hypothetical protein RBB50_011958 [Rhinocladiella similis]
MASTRQHHHLLEDLEVKSLLTRERYYRDSSQWAKLRTSYHPDASRTLIKVSWFEGDADSFVTQSQKMASSGTVARHLFTPVEVHFSKDRKRAVSESTGNITIRVKLGGDGRAYEMTSWARFVSRLEKLGDEWKMLGLEPIYERDTITPVTPGGDTRSLGTFTKGGRESYACLAWVLGLRGYETDMELAGTDRPETVDRLMKSHFEWLE